MYEASKKHNVSEAVAAIFPSVVTDQLFDIIQVMNKAGQIVTAPVAFMFADDSTDTELYAMIVQGDLAPAQEFPLTFAGPKPFLGHGYILIAKDNAKSIYLDFSAANDLD